MATTPIHPANTAARHEDSAPPGYDAVTGIIPAAPGQSQRYVPKQFQLTPVQTMIPSKTRVESFSAYKGSLPEPWQEWLHPEGDTYFYEPRKRIVTPVDPRNQVMLHGVNQAFGHIITHLNNQGDHRFEPLETWINFINVDGGRALYYIVDHQNRSIFWVQQVKTSDVGLASFENPGHYKSMITAEYWQHVDSYPAHIPFPDAAHQELIGILSHGSLDDKTSPGSTCPYSAKECQEYTSVLSCVSKEAYPAMQDGFRTACTARVWSAIARARHINSFGSDRARLDRFQGLENPATSRPKSFLLRVLINLFFGIPSGIYARLARLFNGRVVYQRHWGEFFVDMRQMWMIMGLLGALMIIANGICLASGQAPISFIASTSFASAGVLASTLLYASHPEHSLKTGHDISTYVMRHEDYYNGLHPLSVYLSLPQALMIYAGISFYAGLIQVVVEHSSNWVRAGSTAGAISIGIVPFVTATGFLWPSASVKVPR